MIMVLSNDVENDMEICHINDDDWERYLWDW